MEGTGRLESLPEEKIHVVDVVATAAAARAVAGGRGRARTMTK